jgi:hypothetical protein
MGKNDFGISRAEIVFFLCETAAIFLYGFCTEFDSLSSTTTPTDYKTVEKAEEVAWTRYPMF